MVLKCKLDRILFFRGQFLVAGETRRTRVCCCAGYTIAALLSILREAKVALPTICQQRPRSPSLPLPSLIPFHPPSVHLSSAGGASPSSPHPPHLLAFVLHFIRPVRLQVFIYFPSAQSHHSGLFLFSSSFLSQSQTSWRPARVSSRRLRRHNGAVFWDRCAPAAGEDVPTFTLTLGI